MLLFLGRDAGIMILIKMIQMDSAKGRRRAVEDFLFRIWAAASAYRATHVRNFLERGGKDGPRPSTENRRPVRRTQAALLQAFDRFIADAMSGFDLAYQLAVRAP